MVGWTEVDVVLVFAGKGGGAAGGGVRVLDWEARVLGFVVVVVGVDDESEGV